MEHRLIVGALAALGLMGCGDPDGDRAGGRAVGDDARIRDLDAGVELREGTLDLPFAGEVDILYAVIDDRAFWAGDLLLGDADDVDDGFRAATIASSLWPDGTVKYVIDPGVPESLADVVTSAMSDWVAAAGVRFVEVPADEQGAGGFLRVVDTQSGCFANYGSPAPGKEHQLNLGSGCEYPGVARHELGHVLGLIHEQSRADRDEHVTIDWSNVEPGKAYNFDQYTKVGVAGVDRGAYDYDSLMHYPSSAFAIDPSKPTIVRKDGGLITRDAYTPISAGDAMAVSAMYAGAGGGEDDGAKDDPDDGDGAGAPGSCVGHCDSTDAVVTAEGTQCYCDTSCAEYGDCCGDRDAVCDAGGGDGGEPDGSAGSCVDRCGASDPQPDGNGGSCYCDEACTANGDCCSDHPTACGGTDGGGDPTPGTGSCVGYCGGPGSLGESCYCDEECVTSGDCCSDFASSCGDGGGGGGGSCSGQCGSLEPRPEGCYCDLACAEQGDCCVDYQQLCG